MRVDDDAAHGARFDLGDHRVVTGTYNHCDFSQSCGFQRVKDPPHEGCAADREERLRASHAGRRASGEDDGGHHRRPPSKVMNINEFHVIREPWISMTAAPGNAHIDWRFYTELSRRGHHRGI